MLADLLGYRQHLAEIRRTVVVGRRADADKVEAGVAHRLWQGGGKL